MTQTQRAACPLAPLPADNGHSVYGFVHPVELFALYVGITTNIEQRCKQHFSQKAWIRDMVEEGIPPVMIILESDILNSKTARKYEAYWIRELLKHGHPLQNIQGNLQGTRAFPFFHPKEHFASMKPEDKQRLLTVNMHGITRFGLRYGEIFIDLFMSTGGDWSIDAYKHWIELAEVAYSLCTIPTREDDDGKLRAAVKKYTVLTIEEGMAEDEALEEVTW